MLHTDGFLLKCRKIIIIIIISIIIIMNKSTKKNQNNSKINSSNLFFLKSIKKLEMYFKLVLTTFEKN